MSVTAESARMRLNAAADPGTISSVSSWTAPSSPKLQNHSSAGCCCGGAVLAGLRSSHHVAHNIRHWIHPGRNAAAAANPEPASSVSLLDGILVTGYTIHHHWLRNLRRYHHRPAGSPQRHHCHRHVRRRQRSPETGLLAA
ncbi:hypothetical protein AVEN_98732-1 [Araneus ventricosus]|uniref:Uncharacterized protein n=1 Tax=Araneus ventricosus TaxID=182803 RepID=A0A4Y2TPU3_ARAVE|nr:hypothetical protein AVEN_98732-1 [Araneus ventricosus]